MNIDFDNAYSSYAVSEVDAAFQAIMKGLIKVRSNKKLQVENIDILPSDLYRFTRKYYKRIWTYVTFFQRILCLYNPISEFSGFWETRHIRTQDIFKFNYIYDEYSSYDSKLIRSSPIISIIIPTLNRYSLLNELLDDLELQIYKNFKVIIIDQSKPFLDDFYKKYNFQIKIIRIDMPALWKARNIGINETNSDLLLFLDDDSRIKPDFIIEHLKCLDYFNADISSGESISLIGAKIPDNYGFFRLADQLDTGNVMIKRDVFIKCNTFDENFEKMRMGDLEFAVRSYLNGFINISNPNASRIHLKHKMGGLREMGSWDAYRPVNIFAPRPIPSVLYLYRKYWGNKCAIRNILLVIPISLGPYSLKSRKIGIILSLFLFLSFFPFVLIQVYWSWFISTKMLTSPLRKVSL